MCKTCKQKATAYKKDELFHIVVFSVIIQVRNLT
jgi:hypothetical protein